MGFMENPLSPETTLALPLPLALEGELRELPTVATTSKMPETPEKDQEDNSSNHAIASEIDSKHFEGGGSDGVHPVRQLVVVVKL